MPSTLDTNPYKSEVTGRAHKNWDRADEQFEWAKDQFGENRKRSDQVSDRAMETGADFRDWARTDRGDYEQNVRPAMKQQMDYARDYTTKGRMDANRASAMAGTNLAANTAIKNAHQNLSGFGVDPSSGRFAGLDAGLQAKKAAMSAAAGTKSDRDTEMMGQKLLDNAIGRGQVLPGQVAQGAATGMAADSLGVNASLATTASGASTMGTGLQWGDQGNDMIKEWLKADVAQDTSNQGWEKMKQSESSGTGAAVGAGLGILGGIAGNMMMPGIGGMGGSMFGKMLGGAVAGGTGGSKMAAKGGLITRYQEGGAVRPEPEFAEGGMVDGGTDELGLTPDERQMFEQHWNELGANGDDGGGMPAYAEGGGVEEEETYDLPDEEMGGELTPEVMDAPMDDGMDGGMGDEGMGESTGNMVPPDASPSGGEDVDDVKAYVSVGEFIMPEDVTRWLGEKYLQGLIEKSRRDMEVAPAQPEEAQVPQAMAIAPPTFRSEGASA